MKLNPEYQIQPSDDLIQQSLSRFAINALSDWTEVSEGIGNVVVRIDSDNENPYYLKFYNSKHPIATVGAEVVFTQSIEKYGVPVPRYVPLKEGGYMDTVQQPSGTHAVTLARGLPGRHPKDYQAEMVRDLGMYHGILHDNTTIYRDIPFLDVANDYSYYSYDELNTELSKLDCAVDDVQEQLTEIWEQLPSGLMHLDITRSNILASNGTLTGIVDFEDISNAPNIFCLGGTLWDMHEAETPQRHIKAYISAYEQERPLSDIENQHLRDMIILRGRLALHGSLLSSADGDIILRQVGLLRGMVEGK